MNETKKHYRILIFTVSLVGECSTREREQAELGLDKAKEGPSFLPIINCDLGYDWLILETHFLMSQRIVRIRHPTLKFNIINGWIHD